MNASTVRRSVEALLAETVTQSSFGYTLTAVSFGETVEATLEKAGATFVIWLRPASSEVQCYRRTARFKIGYRHDPPDRLGYALLNAAYARIQVWERSQPELADAHLFDQAPQPITLPGGSAVDSATQALLSQATFSPIYREWLTVRDRQLAAYFEGIKSGRQSILLVNATKGLQFYASIVDFFALLQRIRNGIRVTSASYFEGIFQFHQEVASKGLQVVSVAEVMAWSTAEINRFDVVVMIGPSDIMARIMALEGVSAKLVLLDLGFYHQLLESYPGWYPAASSSTAGKEIYNTACQINRVVVYSCQAQEKVIRNFNGLCELSLLEWRWFNYIPIGFTYRTYYRSNSRGFDVALLGSNERDYSQIDPDLFRGMRFLFLGSTESAPEIDRLRMKLDVTVIARVNEDTYARLLAFCRCVAMPASVHVKSVLLSVIDTVASGKALVTSRNIGLARLERERLPAVFYDASPLDLFRQVAGLIGHDGRLHDIEARAIAFAKEKLDIYRVLQMILEEQILL